MKNRVLKLINTITELDTPNEDVKYYFLQNFNFDLLLLISENLAKLENLTTDELSDFVIKWTSNN